MSSPPPFVSLNPQAFVHQYALEHSKTDPEEKWPILEEASRGQFRRDKPLLEEIIFVYDNFGTALVRSSASLYHIEWFAALCPFSYFGKHIFFAHTLTLIIE